MPSVYVMISWHTYKELKMKNFHLPLPEPTYAQLRAEAERTRIPATSLAREAIDLWLREQKRKSRHEEIAAWALEMSESDFDLDKDLESAGIEHLLETSRPPVRRKSK